MPEAATRATNAGGRETRELLVRTAERLFGEHGIDAVARRQVSGAAGCRMSGAVSYHFGGKVGLLRAIIHDRSVGMDERRGALLAELERQGSVDDLRALLEAQLRPA